MLDISEISLGQPAYGVYLLFCVRASTWPLGNDVLLGLVVGSESKSDTRKGGTLAWSAKIKLYCLVQTHKIDADNQLCLTSAVAFHLGGGISSVSPRGPGHGAGWSLRLRWGVAASITGRRRGPAHDRRRVAGDGSARVNRRRTTSHLRRRGAGYTWVDNG